jgi:hypothetical protein
VESDWRGAVVDGDPEQEEVGGGRWWEKERERGSGGFM